MSVLGKWVHVITHTDWCDSYPVCVCVCEEQLLAIAYHLKLRHYHVCCLPKGYLGAVCFPCMQSCTQLLGGGC